jgi:hypothetical protein
MHNSSHGRIQWNKDRQSQGAATYEVISRYTATGNGKVPVKAARNYPRCNSLKY